MSKNESGIKVAIDMTPVYLQCYDVANCSAINTLKNEVPSVEFRHMPDGSVKAVCPLSVFARVQSIIECSCAGCKAHQK